MIQNRALAPFMFVAALAVSAGACDRDRNGMSFAPSLSDAGGITNMQPSADHGDGGASNAGATPSSPSFNPSTGSVSGAGGNR